MHSASPGMGGQARGAVLPQKTNLRALSTSTLQHFAVITLTTGSKNWPTEPEFVAVCSLHTGGPPQDEPQEPLPPDFLVRHPRLQRQLPVCRKRRAVVARRLDDGRVHRGRAGTALRDFDDATRSQKTHLSEYCGSSFTA